MKEKNTVKTSFKNIMESIDKLRKPLTEAGIFGTPSVGDTPAPQQAAPNGNGQEMPQDGQGDLRKRDPRIARIRDAALDGIRDYSKDPDDEMYQFFKKVFLLCDKAASEKENTAAS